MMHTFLNITIKSIFISPTCLGYSPRFLCVSLLIEVLNCLSRINYTSKSQIWLHPEDFLKLLMLGPQSRLIKSKLSHHGLGKKGEKVSQVVLVWSAVGATASHHL